jgi:hypothetical protein
MAGAGGEPSGEGMMEKLLEFASWPLALVVIALFFFFLFRSPISDLVGRVRGMSYGNKSVDMGGQATGAVEKQKEIDGPAVLAAHDTIPATQMMPPAIEVYAPIEQALRATLKEIDLPHDLEKAWLIRAVATARTQHAHEIVFRLVLGSQITLMLLANTPNPPTTEKAQEIFDQAKTQFPAIYHNFAFEAWRHFPISVGLLRTEVTAAGVTVFKITPAGRDFLHYLVAIH